MEMIEVAESLIFKGKYKDARDLLTTLLEEEPDNSEAVCLIGIALTESGENDKAIKALNYCLGKNGYNSAAWEALGCAWMRKNELIKAETALASAIKLEPKNYSINRNLGVLHVLRKDYKKARELLEAVRLKKPDDYKALYALVYTYLNLKNISEAEKLINVILTFDIPDDIRKDIEHLFIRIQSKLI